MRRWALLGAASVLLALVLDLAGLPAAWLLAPMLAAIAAAVGGMEIGRAHV